MIDTYWEDLKKHHFLQINNRSAIVRGMFLLYQTANALMKYNENILKLSNIQFRARILFPYLIYILQQHLPDTRKFYNQQFVQFIREYNEVLKNWLMSMLIHLFRSRCYKT